MSFIDLNFKDFEENTHEILSTPENSIPIIEVSNEQTDSEVTCRTHLETKAMHYSIISCLE